MFFLGERPRLEVSSYVTVLWSFVASSLPSVHTVDVLPQCNCHIFWGGGIRKMLRNEVEKNSVLTVSEVPQSCMRTSDVRWCCK